MITPSPPEIYFYKFELGGDNRVVTNIMGFLVSLFTIFIRWFLKPRLLGSGVGGLSRWFCWNVYSSFNLSCETWLSLPVYILLFWSFCKLELLGMIRCLSLGWMTRSISLISCKLELHGSDSMQPVGWMTHSISPYCTFLVIVPCGYASCTGRRILFEAAKIK